MKVTNRLLTVLSCVAACMVVVTVIAYQVDTKEERAFVSGEPLIQGLSTSKIGHITVKKGGKEVTLARHVESKDAFGQELKKELVFHSIEQKDNYRAEVKQVDELFEDILEIRCLKLVTSDAGNYAELGVESDKPANGSVLIKDLEGSVTAKIYVGKAGEENGHFIRRDGQDEVYLTEKALNLNADPMHYVDKNPLSVEKDDVERVAVVLVKGQVPTDAYMVERKDGKPTLTLAEYTNQGMKPLPLPKGKQQKDSEVDGVLGALSYLTVEDLKLVSTELQPKLALTSLYSCKIKDGLEYSIRIVKIKDDKGKLGKDSYVMISAIPADARRFMAETRGKALNEEMQKKLTKIIASNQEAADLEKHHGWLYKIGSWKVDSLAKPSSKLLEDVPITASHILFSYKGAERADAKITRTKEEAKKLAEELLKKVKAADADFAKLAKDNSDGPSKTKGGDVGAVDNMAKPFKEAAEKLKVGEISDVVETTFGFHIIKRTK